MTERYENDKTYRALVDALWYNVGAEAIKTIVDKFKEFNQEEHSQHHREHWFPLHDLADMLLNLSTEPLPSSEEASDSAETTDCLSLSLIFPSFISPSYAASFLLPVSFIPP